MCKTILHWRVSSLYGSIQLEVQTPGTAPQMKLDIIYIHSIYLARVVAGDLLLFSEVVADAKGGRRFARFLYILFTTSELCRKRFIESFLSQRLYRKLYTTLLDLREIIGEYNSKIEIRLCLSKIQSICITRRIYKAISYLYIHNRRLSVSSQQTAINLRENIGRTRRSILEKSLRSASLSRCFNYRKTGLSAVRNEETPSCAAAARERREENAL